MQQTLGKVDATCNQLQSKMQKYFDKHDRGDGAEINWPIMRRN
jgi:hypothetical protein